MPKYTVLVVGDRTRRAKYIQDCDGAMVLRGGNTAFAIVAKSRGAAIAKVVAGFGELGGEVLNVKDG